MCRLIELSRCRSFRCLTNLLAFGSVLSITSAFAEQPAGAVAKPAAKPTETRTQAHTESAAIPEWAEKINLTGQQQGQIKEIVRNYDASLGLVWNQFSERYMAGYLHGVITDGRD